ncbi:hypothetical protein HYW74_00550 [Candidatus Pacearchaeota archaeon]|nr:hypothetical protein [Candidatus Pacearchaeota archaeon]
MENAEKPVKRRFNLTSILVGVAIGIVGTNIGSYVSTYKLEQPKVTKTIYQDYQVQINKYPYRTVVIMENTKTPVKIHGEDRGNNGSIDFAENIMGFPGTGSDQKVLQETYDALRKK